MLAKQIIDIDFQLIKAKSTNFPSHSHVPHLSAAHSPLPQPFSALAPAPQPLEPHPPQPQPLEINDMVGILTETPRQIPNLYCKPGQPIGAPVNHFRQIKYLLLPNTVPDLDQALSGAKVDCARDFDKELIEFGGAENVWMTVQVEFKPVNPLANKLPFEHNLSAAPTNIFRRDEQISGFANPYKDNLRILTDQIKEFNAMFIRDKSGHRLDRVLQLTLKMVKYAPLEGRGWQALPDFLANKKAIINIRNNDERCFGYSLLYFLERANLPEQNNLCVRSTS